MSDEAFKAKEWLSRTFALYDEIEAEKRTLGIIKLKLNSGVRNYESITRNNDFENSIRWHEDLLLEYTLQNERVEKAKQKLFRELELTRTVIDKVKKPLYRAIATDRYINALNWNEMNKAYDYSSSKMYREHIKTLEAIGRILTASDTTTQNDIIKSQRIEA